MTNWQLIVFNIAALIYVKNCPDYKKHTSKLTSPIINTYCKIVINMCNGFTNCFMLLFLFTLKIKFPLIHRFPHYQQTNYYKYIK